MGDYDVNWAEDAYDLKYLDRSKGQVYMAAVSPWFFTVPKTATGCWRKALNLSLP